MNDVDNYEILETPQSFAQTLVLDLLFAQGYALAKLGRSKATLRAWHVSRREGAALTSVLRVEVRSKANNQDLVSTKESPWHVVKNASQSVLRELALEAVDEVARAAARKP